MTNWQFVENLNWRTVLSIVIHLFGIGALILALYASGTSAMNILL